ncbi:MAG: DinB family protein [Williamsia sp.]|nr:DinB family protein [Williamsia sp.]
MTDKSKAETVLVVPSYAQGYVDLVRGDKLPDALKKTTKAFRKLLKQMPAKKIDYAYAPGKWTIRQLLQHIIDAERVFAFRALWFARKDGQPLPGFDENSWARTANPSVRDWEDMVQEYKLVRKATELLFKSFGPEELKAIGTSNNAETSVAAWGYICAGHVAHHINIIRQRYLAG